MRAGPVNAVSERRRSGRGFAVAGVVAPALFVGVFTVEGWLRPGYLPASMFVSELSLGPRGWVQITNFLLTGALIVVFGHGLSGRLRSGPAARAGPILVQIVGASLMLSGLFATDPSAMFDQTSVHGIVHGVLGAIVFSLAPVTCLVFFRRLRRDPARPVMAWWTLAAGILLVVGIVVLKLGQMPDGSLFAYKGLIQRAVLVIFMGWLFSLAAVVLASRDGTEERSYPGPPARS